MPGFRAHPVEEAQARRVSHRQVERADMPRLIPPERPPIPLRIHPVPARSEDAEEAAHVPEREAAVAHCDRSPRQPPYPALVEPRRADVVDAAMPI